MRHFFKESESSNRIYDDGTWKLFKINQLNAEELIRVADVDMRPFTVKGIVESKENATKLSDCSRYIDELREGKYPYGAKKDSLRKADWWVVQYWENKEIVYQFVIDFIRTKEDIYVYSNLHANDDRDVSWQDFRKFPSEMSQMIVCDNPEMDIYGCNLLELREIAGPRAKRLDTVLNVKKRKDPFELGIFSEIDGFVVNKAGVVQKWPARTVEEWSEIGELVIPEGVTGFRTVVDSKEKEKLQKAKLDVLVLPSSLRRINRALNSCQFKEIVFSEGLEEIENYAFTACNELVKIELPSSLKELGSFAFQSCKKLEYADLSKTQLRSIEKCTFGTCKALQTVELPRNLKRIGESAFEHDSLLEEVTFPEGLEEIEKFAFFDSGMALVDLPDSLKKLGNRAFSLCHQLARVFLPDCNLDCGDYIFADCERLKKVKNMQTVSKSTGVFKGSENVRDLKDFKNKKRVIKQSDFSEKDLPENFELQSITEVIGDKAFERAPFKTFKGSPKLKAIGTNAFNRSTVELVDLSMCTDLEVIGNNAFSECWNLKSIILPDNKLQLGVGAFSSCTSLSSIKLPKFLRKIPRGCFASCSNLGDVEWPLKLKSIGRSAFDHTALQTIELPATLLQIGSRAFCCAKKLETVKAFDKLSIIEDNAFEDCESLIEFEVASDDPEYDQYEEIIYGRDSFKGTPYEEVLVAAGVKQGGKAASMYESRKRFRK